MGGFGGQQQASQTTSTQLSPQANELFNLAMPLVRGWASQVPPRYPGSTVAGPDMWQTQGQETALQMTPQQAQVATQGIHDAAALRSNLNWSPDTMSWDPAKNPHLRAAIEAAQRPVYDQLKEITLPGIRDTSVSTGGYGGSRQGIAEGLAMSRADRTAADIGAKITQDLYRANLESMGQRYGQNINALLGLSGLVPMQQQSLVTPALTQSNVGDVRQAQTQAELGDRVAGFNYDTMAPFVQAQDLIGLTSAMPSSTTTTANSPRPSPFSSIAGGALAGAGLGSMFPVVGSGIGALGGGLAGLLFS